MSGRYGVVEEIRRMVDASADVHAPVLEMPSLDDLRRWAAYEFNGLSGDRNNLRWCAGALLQLLESP